MSRHRVDVCIVGDGPAALLLQAMLIEHGVSTLRLRDGRRPPGHWQHPHRSSIRTALVLRCNPCSHNHRLRLDGTVHCRRTD